MRVDIPSLKCGKPHSRFSAFGGRVLPHAIFKKNPVTSVFQLVFPLLSLPVFVCSPHRQIPSLLCPKHRSGPPFHSVRASIPAVATKPSCFLGPCGTSVRFLFSSPFSPCPLIISSTFPPLGLCLCCAHCLKEPSLSFSVQPFLTMFLKFAVPQTLSSSFPCFIVLHTTDHLKKSV